METQIGHAGVPRALEQGQAYRAEATVEAPRNLGNPYQAADVIEHPRAGYVQSRD